MTHAYDKLYLDKAQTALGRMLDFAVYDLKYDISEFFDLFLVSGIADRFETIRAGGSFSPEEHVLPCRADFAATYTVIRRLARMGIDSFSHRVLLTKIHTEYGGDVNSIKLRFIILIFKELNLLTIQEQGDRYTVRLHNATTKTDLEKSTLLRRLRGQERHNGQESYHV